MEDSRAARSRFRTLSWIALAGVVLTGAQIAFLLVRGRILCINDGCRVVEGLTTVPPLAFNLVGLSWFAATAGLMLRYARRPPWSVNWAMLLLLGGTGVEAVLLAYQIFVAKALCAYCLVVFSLVLALNVAAGLSQAFGAAAVVGGVLAVFAMLRFGLPPKAPAPGMRGLDAGTFAVRRCSDPAKQLYLIFSSSCPHCEAVIKALENCNSCNFHFNPVDRIASLALDGIERAKGYDPGVNTSFLSLLGVEEVPVLLAAGPEGVSVIRGENRILGYIREECFRAEPVLNLDPSRALDQGGLHLFREEDDGCSVTVECPPGQEPPKGGGNP